MLNKTKFPWGPFSFSFCFWFALFMIAFIQSVWPKEAVIDLDPFFTIARQSLSDVHGQLALVYIACFVLTGLILLGYRELLGVERRRV